MARPGVTLQEVEHAVGALEHQGQRATQIMVRRALGDRGSMTTIKAHLETLRQARANTHRERRELPSELAEAITRAMTGVWEQAAAMARADIEAIRIAAQERSEGLSLELDELSRAYDEQVRDLDQARATSEKIAEELRAAMKALTVAVAERTELRRMYEALLAKLDPQAEDTTHAADNQLKLDLDRRHRPRRKSAEGK